MDDYLSKIEELPVRDNESLIRESAEQSALIIRNNQRFGLASAAPTGDAKKSEEFLKQHAWNSMYIVDTVRKLRDENASLIIELAESNSLLRSAYAIAARDGRETNWDAFLLQLENALARQRELLAKLQKVGVE